MSIDDVNSYIPLDELLARPRYRILRFLRRSDPVTMADIFDAIDVPTYDNGRSPERRRHEKALSRLVEEGLVEMERMNNASLYRIAEAGIAVAKDPVADARAAQRRRTAGRAERPEVSVAPGMRIGDLEVIEPAGERIRPTGNGDCREQLWLVRCLCCGETRTLRTYNAARGQKCRKCAAAAKRKAAA